MTTFPFEISAQLLLTVQQDQVMVVAEENYIIVNFQDHAALERVLENIMPPSAGKGVSGLVAGIEKAKDLNKNIWQAGLIIDVRVNNKTYLELGSSASPKITANAIFGKVGSWFK